MAESDDPTSGEPTAPRYANLDLEWPEHVGERSAPRVEQSALFDEDPPEPEMHHPMSEAHGYRVFRDLSELAPSPRNPGRGRFAHRGWTVDLELKVREERAHGWAFRQLAGRLAVAMQRRVYEAVLTRAARRFLVQHVQDLIPVAKTLPRRGRELTEEDWLDIMNAVFTVDPSASLVRRSKSAPAEPMRRAASR